MRCWEVEELERGATKMSYFARQTLEIQVRPGKLLWIGSGIALGR
jgi:hypothetical protein